MEPAYDHRIGRDQLCMDVAQLFAERSTCRRAHVGAAIARDGRILVTGYNGAPAGLPHCGDECHAGTNGGCKSSVHAESNCIAYAARYGIAVDGATLYCTHLPCRKCAELAVNSGIAKVVYLNDYRDHAGLELLRSAGIDLEMLE